MESKETKRRKQSIERRYDMRTGTAIMILGLALTGLGITPFVFMAFCTLAGLAEIKMERDGWK
jgi:hypothetical protein